MVRQKASTTKSVALPSSPDKRKRRARASAPKEQPSLHTVHQIKEAGKQTHLRAAKTRATYARHVRQAQSWLQSHFLAEGTQPSPSPSHVGSGDLSSEVYGNPDFKNAFERVPNQCSDKALALYLSWKGFQENCSQSTIDGVRAAFKLMWDEAYAWHYNSERQRWEGNPVRSAEVDDVIASIRHKVNSQGSERTHSGAMKKEYLDMILAWSNSCCPLDSPLQYIHLVMTNPEPSVPPLGKWATDAKMKLTTMRHIEQLACAAVAFMLNYELVRLKHGDIKLDRTAVDSVFLKYLRGEEGSLTINDLGVYFEVHLRNRKGWQRKLDKGMREIDLRSNRYKVYPRPDMGKACDVFMRLVFWMRWIEIVHLGRPMANDDFLFPAVGANGVLQPGEPLSHDMVQKWIDEGVTGAGIPGTFSTHCYRRGGAQYRFMYAPVGQRWTLAHVRWWGGWAEGEHRDTLMRYLLDELHCYETDHSDALGLISREAEDSLAGEAALVQPASTEALRMAHAALTADVAALHSMVKKMSHSQAAMSADVREIHQKLGDMSNCQRHQCSSTQNRTTILPPPTVHSIPAAQPHDSQPLLLRLPHLVQLPLDVSPATQFLPSRIGPERTNNRSTSSAAPLGLLIPDVPVLRADGTRTPRSDSWKDIVCHWTKGEPWLNLHTPLKDWPHHYYNGECRRLNTKHYQRKVMATEFLNEFQGNEDAFLRAYGSAACLGHTRLLNTILAARRRYRGDGERRRHLANEVHGGPSQAGRQ
ncbi:hypothetical protein M404DRAFT_122553 [Pisolithus tinctorius Marx 270]|uniref:Tyr recombinase domain-containing protein n=1 Tax=Pisolithus tinctorius Marx 270 TaxID=870435 RepID=A0A0C3PX61_PISTI|nr:hypothetical protein M404DRAFT_122553 [Pisolithus tinctorius Marx 270]